MIPLGLETHAEKSTPGPIGDETAGDADETAADETIGVDAAADDIDGDADETASDADTDETSPSTSLLVQRARPFSTTCACAVLETRANLCAVTLNSIGNHAAAWRTRLARPMRLFPRLARHLSTPRALRTPT